MIARALATLACAVACAEGCAPGDGDDAGIPPIVWSGEHLDFAPQEHAEPVCAGTLAYMDRYMGLAGAAMGIEVGRSVYVHGSETDPPLCPAVGCLRDGEVIYSRRAPLEHELIHAVRSSDEIGFRFFEEGAAEAFGGDDELNPDRIPAWEPLREGIESCSVDEPLADRWYPRAGAFFAYLHRYHRREATTALIHTAPIEATPDEAIEALEVATNMSFDELVDDYESTEPYCDKTQSYRYPLFPCDAPEALRPRCDGDVAIPVEVSLGCDDANTLGPRDGRVFTYVAVEIPVSGHYRIKGAPREDAHRGGIHFKECALGCSSWSAPRSYNELDDEIWLRAGRYSLRFDRAVDAETLATMAVTIAGEDCW